MLRPILNDDLPWVFRGLSDPHVYRHYGVRYHTIEEAREQMAWYEQIRAESTGEWFAITDNAGTPVGAIGFNDYERAHRKAEIGYWLLHEYWGMGFIRPAISAMLELGFGEWNLHRIEAIVEPENLASTQLLKAFGFTLEGTRRECEIKDGKYISLEIYSLLEQEYRSG